MDYGGNMNPVLWGCYVVDRDFSSRAMPVPSRPTNQERTATCRVE